jgi:hypothetical protein
MNRNFLICLLVFSLALNLGGLATFGYLRLQDHRESMMGRGLPPPLPREIWAALNLEVEQRQVLENLLPEHRRRVRDLRLALAQQRFELFALAKEEVTNTSTPARCLKPGTTIKEGCSPSSKAWAMFF